MKKRLIASFALALFLGIGAQSAHAATVTTFFPGSVVTSVGENFDLPILINPHGVKNYSAALQVNYPADLVTVTGFTFGDKAIRLTVDEYDYINNTNGTLVKAAGFPGGITDTAVFGTIHFKAKKAGSAAVLFGTNSKALDVNNQNVLQPDNTINAVITIHPATVTPKPVSNTSSSGGTKTSGASSNSSSAGASSQNTVISPAVSVSPSPELTGVGGPEEGTFGSDSSQLGAAAGSATSTASSIFAGKGTAIAIGLVILIIIIGIIYGASRGA